MWTANMPYFYMPSPNMLQTIVAQPLFSIVASLGATIFAIIGALIIIVPPAFERLIITTLSIHVDAKVFDRKEMEHKGNTYVYLVWRYEYEGNEYFYFDTRGRINDDRKIGYKGVLAIKKYNPEKVYRFMTEGWRHRLKLIGAVIMGVSAVCTILLMLL